MTPQSMKTLIMLVFSGQAGLLASQYAVTPLSLPQGFVEGFAQGINDSGNVLFGARPAPSGPLTGYFFGTAKGLTPIPSFAPFAVTGFNNLNQAVGFAADSCQPL